jgi:tRNA(fMet)-specific endonuclease VapC
MTGNKILLDTNIVSALLEGDTALADKIDAADDVFISLIVIGEMYFGAYNSTRITKNIAGIVAIKAQYSILMSDAETAEIYGEIKTGLRKKGKPIPENDIWIATIAIQHQLKLISRDGHFNEVDRLDWEVW